MSELLDQFHTEALAADRAWSPEEVAGRILRMKAGAGTSALVRAVLVADGRFHERPDGHWEVRAAPAVSLAAEPLRLCWFEVGEGDALRLHLAVWTPGRPAGSVLEIDGADPSRWFSRASELLAERWATLQPSLCARWFWRMDRRWAFGESVRPPLDLLAWSRVALLDEGIALPDLARESAPESLAARWSVGSHSEDGPGRLRLLAQLLDHLAELYPEWTDSDLERVRGERLESRSLDWSSFDFPRGALDEVPHGPGIYRLRGQAGDLVYVGKALDLNRRLQEHFRPLPPERSKREEMLGDVRTFEYEELPSELDALVREHRSIVEEAPRWNVQVEVHPPRRFPPDWTWPLVYIAPGVGPIRSLVMLSSVDRGALVRIDPVSPEGANLTEALAFLSDPDRFGREDLPFLQLEPAEAWLALRYFVRFRDRIDRIDPLAVLSTEEFAARVAALTVEASRPHPHEIRG